LVKGFRFFKVLEVLEILEIFSFFKGFLDFSVAYKQDRTQNFDPGRPS